MIEDLYYVMLYTIIIVDVIVFSYRMYQLLKNN